MSCGCGKPPAQARRLAEAFERTALRGEHTAGCSTLEFLSFEPEAFDGAHEPAQSWLAATVADSQTACFIWLIPSDALPTGQQVWLLQKRSLVCQAWTGAASRASLQMRSSRQPRQLLQRNPHTNKNSLGKQLQSPNLASRL